MRVNNVTLDMRASKRAGHPLQTIAASLFLFSMVTVGSVSQAQAQSFRFNTVSVEGNALIDDASILSYARIIRSRSMSAAELNAAYQRVATTGFFRSVDFVPQGNTLVIQVEEYPLISRISIEGNRRLDDDALSPLLASRPGGVFSPSQAEADANAIAAAYAESGRLAARVEPRLIERAGGRVDLVFEVTEGAVVEVERISFVGNRSFSERRLRNAIESSQAGRLSTLFRSDNYNEARIARDRQALADFYLSRGFIDVQVLSGVNELSRERDGTSVTFTVREGQQYRVGTVTVVSEIAGIDAAPYQAALSDREGRLFTPTVLESVIQQAEHVGYQAGQRFVRAEPRLVRRERDGVIDVELALVRGERVFIERIDIQGNATTQDNVIRRQFDVAEGDPLNPRELREAASRIESLGYFSDVSVTPNVGSSPEQAVVDVRVDETTTGSLNFGLSYGSSGGAGVNVSYNESNFLGRGQRLNVTLSTVADAQSLSFNFTEPALLGRDLALGLNVGLNTTSATDSARFDTRQAVFSPSLSFPISEYGRLETRFSYGREEITIPAAQAALVAPRIASDAGSADTGSVGFTYTHDTRRIGPDPDRGYVFRFSSDIAGLGGDRQWARSTVMAGYEQRLGEGDVTLRAEFEAGMVHHRSGPSRITERFNLSSAQFRGFDPYGIGPVGYNGATRNGLGGNFFAVARLEAEFPIGLPSQYNVHGGAFIDAGSVWGVDNPTADVIDDNAIRVMAGVSLFWDSPIGPLRLNFASPIQVEAYDEVRRFDLTIAARF